MASRKKQIIFKEKFSDASHGNAIKKTKKMHALTTRLSDVTESTSDEEDALEMEKNFELFSKRNSVVEEKDEDRVSDGGAEDDDDDDGTMENEEDPETSGDSSSNEEGESGQIHDSGSSMKLQRDLSTMAFEEIMKLQNKIGIKTYSKIAFGEKKVKPTAEPKKQLSKCRPDEISAKKPVPYLRKVVHVKKTILRDPRFDDLSGEFRPQVFKHTYKFIDEIRQKETQMLKKKLKKIKSSDRKEELKSLLKRMENQERARHQLEQQQEKEIQFKKQQQELVAQGHRPFYLKKSDKKKLELAEKYNQLKKSGKLEKFLSKKRKRNAMKDRRKLPHQHKNI